MRAVFGFFSMLALGLMLAAVIVVAASDATNGPIRLPISGVYLDYASVVIGLALGVVIVVLGQIRWSELVPRAAVGRRASAQAAALRLGRALRRRARLLLIDR